ncbi:P-loop NTPase [archaeon]|jgi:septum site-determining protein MinD|nr:P-loop NTPase [archaeon]MBT4648478.1 P-loop NTPase [archaeon]MBT6821713.1 P-loop NTPase [archaeon]MBT7391376.1 P-loop NTPase [archaeon]
MTKFIVIASGKGGVGKTTTAINLGSALSTYGKDVIVVDANISTPNIGIYLGSSTVPISLHNVLRDENHISEAIYMHANGLKIIPGSISAKDSGIKHHEKLSEKMLDLTGMTDIVIIDSGAGISEESISAIKSGDEIILVTHPELASITDTIKTINVAKKHGKKIAGVIITRSSGDDLDIPLKNIETLLEHKIIGEIPDDDTFRAAKYTKNPITYSHPESAGAIAYKKLAAKLLGQKYVHSVTKKEDSMMDDILKKIGFK